MKAIDEIDEDVKEAQKEAIKGYVQGRLRRISGLDQLDIDLTPIEIDLDD